MTACGRLGDERCPDLPLHDRSGSCASRSTVVDAKPASLLASHPNSPQQAGRSRGGAASGRSDRDTQTPWRIRWLPAGLRRPSPAFAGTGARQDHADHRAPSRPRTQEPRLPRPGPRGRRESQVGHERSGEVGHSRNLRVPDRGTQAAGRTMSESRSRTRSDTDPGNCRRRTTPWENQVRETSPRQRRPAPPAVNPHAAIATSAGMRDHFRRLPVGSAEDITMCRHPRPSWTRPILSESLTCATPAAIPRAL